MDGQKIKEEEANSPKPSTSGTGFRRFQIPVITTFPRLSAGQAPRSMGPEAGQSSSSGLQHEPEPQDMTERSERLSMLHAKLSHEAEKIRKWKNQAELDIQQKDQMLSEANTTIDLLRKSNLELKLENDNLRITIEGEESSKEEVMQKIQNTKALIRVLKDHEQRLEERIFICESECTELKKQEKEHSEQVEKMTDKFKGMQKEGKQDAGYLSVVTQPGPDSSPSKSVSDDAAMADAEQGQGDGAGFEIPTQSGEVIQPGPDSSPSKPINDDAATADAEQGQGEVTQPGPDSSPSKPVSDDAAMADAEQGQGDGAGFESPNQSGEFIQPGPDYSPNQQVSDDAVMADATRGQGDGASCESPIQPETVEMQSEN